jgi:activator of 2-hydroxyglutaryl-CoA dehydratase
MIYAGIDVGSMSAEAVLISSICTVFTQFDAMCFLADGRTRGRHPITSHHQRVSKEEVLWNPNPP